MAKFRARQRKVQRGITEIRYGSEWDDYKLLTPENMKLYKRSPQKFLKKWRNE